MADAISVDEANSIQHTALDAFDMQFKVDVPRVRDQNGNSFPRMQKF